MTALYNKTYYNQIKKQKNKLLIVYLVLLSIALISVAGIIVYYALQPYGTNKKIPLMIAMFLITCIFTLFSGVYLSIPYGRVKKYYAFLTSLLYGKKQKFNVTVISISGEDRSNYGVDFYVLEVIEWSDTQNDYVNHKILVDNEFKNLDINEGDMLTITTSLNALMEFSKINETTRN